MGTIFLGLLIWLVFLIGLIASFRWLIRHPRTAVVVVLIVLAGVWTYHRGELSLKDQQLSIVTPYLGVTKVLYIKSSIGIGPGGNGSEVIVYDLPDEVVAQLRANGLKYLADLQANYSRDSLDHSKHLGPWKETPLGLDPDWASPSRGDPPQPPKGPGPRLYNVVSGEPFGITVDPAIESEIDEAVSKPGSHFAKAGYGMLIVMPKVRKVAYVIRK